MFTAMALANFKGWQKTGTKPIRLAPITLFFGPNSSGKTSLIQSILLLKQTAESQDRTRVLHTGDDRSPIDLGTPQDVVHGHDLGRTIDFTLRWKLPNGVLPQVTDSREMQFIVSVGLLHEGSPVVQTVRYLFDGPYVTMQRRPDGGYEVSSAGFGLKRRRGRPEILPNPIRFYGFPDEVRSSFVNADWLSDLALEVENQLGRVVYVGPLREYPKRSYLWTGLTPPDVGVRGNLAVMAVLAASIQKRRIGRGEGTARRYTSFEEVIAGWLKKMGMIASFRVKLIAKNRREYEVRVRKTAKSPEVLITDVGFGVSQVLPVLVQAYYAPPGSTIVFEQPEIHLHPRVQADLAEVFVDAAKRCNVQFLIESHSEHLLRRLQRLIAEEKVSSQDVALYVCDSDVRGSTIEPLDVDEYGNIRNWPKDFFGDAMGDLVKMTQAAAKRRKLQ